MREKRTVHYQVLQGSIKDFLLLVRRIRVVKPQGSSENKQPVNLLTTQ